MEQLAVVARLKPGGEAKAAELIAEGPPYGLDGTRLASHTVYLSAGEIVFVFEGAEVEWIVDSIIDDPFHWELIAAFDRWRSLIEGSPRIARPAFSWRREDGAPS